MNAEAGSMPTVEIVGLDLGASLVLPASSCIYDHCPPGVVCESATSRRCISYEKAQAIVPEQESDRPGPAN
jgi:hypothetical protein